MGIEVTITNISEDVLDAIADRVYQKQQVNQTPELKTYNTEDVARILRTSKQTVGSLIRKNKLKATKGSKSYIITQESLNDYINHAK